MSGYRNLSSTFLQQRRRQIERENEGSVERCLREFREKTRSRPDRDLLVSEWHIFKGAMTKRQRAHYFYQDGRRRSVDADGSPLPAVPDELAAQCQRPKSAKAERKAKHDDHIARVAERRK